MYKRQLLQLTFPDGDPQIAATIANNLSLYTIVLDVYKRQVLSFLMTDRSIRWESSVQFITYGLLHNDSRELVEPHTRQGIQIYPVSYTHLDVYKRQTLWWMLIPMK